MSDMVNGRDDLIWQKFLALVGSVTSQLANFTDLDSLTQEISHLILQTFNYYYVAVFTLEPNSSELIFRASARTAGANRPQFEYVPGAKLKVGEHIVGYVAQTGQQLLANDTSQEPRYGHLDTLSETKAEVALPLLINTQVVGVLDVQSDQVNAFDESELFLLKALADNIAIAVHRILLYESARKRSEQLAIIAEVSQAITVILDLDELLEKVVTLIQERFAYPYVHVFLIRPANKQVYFKVGSGSRAAAFKQAEIAYNLEAEQGIIPWVARHGLHQCINDVSTDPNFIPNPITKDISGSELALPLKFGGEVLGVLDIQSDKINTFTLEDQELLQTLSANIAIAVRNAKLYRSERWRRQVAESLRDVSVLLTENMPLENVLQIILEKLQKDLPCDVAGIWLFDGQEPTENWQNSYNLHLAAFNTGKSADFDLLNNLPNSQTSWFNKALDHNKPLIRQVNDPMDPIGEVMGLAPYYSSIAAPLQTSGQTLGLLTLHHHTAGRYGLESQNVTASFAGFAAISIENARLYETSQEQAWISTVLLQVAQATQSLSTIPELVSTVVRLTPLLVGVEGCALFLRESEADVFWLHAIYGSVFKDADVKQPIALGNTSLFSDLLVNQAPLIVSNPKTDINLPESLCQNLSDKTLIMLPLVTHNQLLGAFLLIQSEPFPEDEKDLSSDQRLAIIQGITQQTAIAVENIRLLEAKQVEAYVSAVLLQVAQAVVSSENLADTLESIVHIIPILVGIDCCILYLWDPLTHQFQTSHVHCSSDQATPEVELLENIYSEGEFPMLDLVSSTNKTIIHPIETALPPEDWDLIIPDETIKDFTPILTSQYGLLMGFPLSVKGDSFGVLITQELKFNPNRDRRLELMTGIAQQASLAIQNDHLTRERVDRERLDREFQLAADIQRTFLPEHLPVIEGFECDVRWHTARQVGGDFYDFFERSPDEFGIVIADVSDKGLAASLYMTVARTLLRAVALESNSTARTLEKVNDLLLLDSQNGLFVTVFYAILDRRTGSLRYTNAGHNRPFLLEASTHTMVELKQGGIAIGAMPNIVLPESEITLAQGDCLVMHTDGVTEAFDAAGNMYGDIRYRKMLRRSLDFSTQEILNRIEADLDDFRQATTLSDDITLLALKRI